MIGLLRILAKPGVEGALRVDLLRMGRSLDELGSGFSWTDLKAVMTHLIEDGSSAFGRAVATVSTEAEKPPRQKYTAAQLRAAVLARTT